MAAPQAASPQLTMVVPIYNEENALIRNLSLFGEAMDEVIGPGAWKYLLVNNDSTDRSPELILKIIERWPLSNHITQKSPNYGAALRAGLTAVDTPFAGIADVERWDVPFLAWAWSNRETYDLFIGSKRSDPTLCNEPILRRILSWGLNSVLQLLFLFPGTDAHGPKLIKMQTVGPVIKQSQADRGQYDVEFVLRALRARLRLVEAPVAHDEVRPPRAAILKKILWNLIALTRLWLRLKHIPFEGTIRYYRFSREELVEQFPDEKLAKFNPKLMDKGEV